VADRASLLTFLKCAVPLDRISLSGTSSMASIMKDFKVVFDCKLDSLLVPSLTSEPTLRWSLPNDNLL
jgi:hypothetical protein